MVACKVCYNFTLYSYDENELCEVCFWRHDSSIEADDDPSALNKSLTLFEGRRNYKFTGAFHRDYINKVRPPTFLEIPQRSNQKLSTDNRLSGLADIAIRMIAEMEKQDIRAFLSGLKEIVFILQNHEVPSEIRIEKAYFLFKAMQSGMSSISELNLKDEHDNDLTLSLHKGLFNEYESLHGDNKNPQ